MKICVYSDLHLEFGTMFKPPSDAEYDLMILAGDIVVLKDPEPLSRFLDGWNKPVLYVPGNHEYYTNRPMTEEDVNFRAWLAERYPNVSLLLNEAVSIGGVNFFGGTMWTDFSGADKESMDLAGRKINDFRLIRTEENCLLTPSDTVAYHQNFKQVLIKWFEKPFTGPRIVVTHHMPCLMPASMYEASPLIPAFNSFDMIDIIERFKPHYWICGHTHECGRWAVGETLFVSNQLGYPNGLGGFECINFDFNGCMIEI